MKTTTNRWRVLRVFGAALLMAIAIVVANAGETLAMPYCDGSWGRECRSTRVCAGVPGTDNTACLIRYYYEYELAY